MKKFFEEFKKFISRGNVIDLAVGVIIGGAFTGIVNSLVKDIIMPIIGILTGGIDFAALSFSILNVPINIGSIITAIINFLLIALVLFIMIKTIEKVYNKNEEARKELSIKCPDCLMDVDKDAKRCPYCTSYITPVIIEEEVSNEDPNIARRLMVDTTTAILK